MELASNSELSKAYVPSEHEAEIYKMWEYSGAFKPAGDQNKDSFCIIMPPPNANGNLHTGHAMYLVDDILVRYWRMQGRPTLWLPGTDHAGIETQVVFEKELAKEGKSRFDFTPSEFYDATMDFVKSNEHVMIDQMRSLGFSADWSKLKFTLDTDIIDTVYDTFKQLHDDDYIYRGNRIVNWCPRCHAGFADIEIKHRDQIDPLYYIKYGPFVVATVRPEPMFADTGIAVHPKDERYKEWIGKEVDVDLLWGPKKLKVIADEHVDPEFGTGVVKLTPAHDHNDWEMAQKHGLDVIQGIGTDGTITEAGGKFAGMKASDARDEIVRELEAKGLIDHIDMNYTHSVAIHDRCGTQIEPLCTEQWWLKVDKLKQPAIAAIKNGEVEFYPTRFKKMALNWLEDLRDWNLSRQIWWGIRIPVYYNATKDSSLPDYIIAKDESEAIKVYGQGGYEAETDTFDTWFSSGQWPFATLMATGDFDKFYPTSVMATMRDILYIWVTRMIMLGIYKTGVVPFRDVYLWGSVNDAQGKKMSKSKGNVINPLDMTSKFGTDALRLSLTIGITPGTGGSISEEKIQGYRNFCNKLWNVARFILAKVPEGTDPKNAKLLSPADHWIVDRINKAIESVTKDLEGYKFSEAGQTIYSLLWDDIADKYIEYSKQSPNNELLAYCLDTILRLAHPIAPFVTEAIWQHTMWTNSNLITEQWPNVIHSSSTDKAKEFEIEIIKILSAKQKDANKVELIKLDKELALKQNMAKISEGKLSNDSFVANAPKEVVDAENARLKQALSEVKDIEEQIEKLKSTQ
jgi:valyl-tRNA synthetase